MTNQSNNLFLLCVLQETDVAGLAINVNQEDTVKDVQSACQAVHVEHAAAYHVSY
jgi:hypothetical protein